MRTKLSYLSRRVPQQLSVGRWTQDEKLLFLLGLKRYGKGRWKKMSVYLPHRYVWYVLDPLFGPRPQMCLIPLTTSNTHI
jgi:hypothetical protein